MSVLSAGENDRNKAGVRVFEAQVLEEYVLLLSSIHRDRFGRLLRLILPGYLEPMW